MKQEEIKKKKRRRRKQQKEDGNRDPSSLWKLPDDNCFSQQDQKETFAVKMKVENVFH